MYLELVVLGQITGDISSTEERGQFPLVSSVHTTTALVLHIHIHVQCNISVCMHMYSVYKYFILNSFTHTCASTSKCKFTCSYNMYSCWPLLSNQRFFLGKLPAK